MKKKLEEIVIIFILSIILFIVINIGIVVWNYVDPTGFFQFLWFLSLLSTIIFGLGLLIWGLITFFVFITSSKGFLEIVLTILIGSVLSLIVLANSALVSIPTIFVQITLSDKSKYINSTEYLLNRGEFEKAMHKSERILQKAIADTIAISQIWFLQNWIERSNKGRKKAKFNYFNALTNYAYSISNVRNNFEEAERLFLLALEYSNSEFPHDKQLATFIYPFLMEIYFIRNDYYKANLAYLKILEYSNESDGESIESIVESLLFYSAFADFYFNTELAFDLKRQAFDIYEKSDLKKTNHIYFTLCLNLANEYLQRQQINIGEAYLYRIARIAQTFKDDYYSYRTYLITKSGYELLKGNYDQSEKTLKELLKITRKRQGKKSFDYANSMALIASHYRQIGNYKKSGEFYDKSLDILYSYRNENPDDFINILFFSSISDFFNGKTEVSNKKLLEVRSFLINQMNGAFIFMTTEEKESYISHLTKRFQTINTVIFSLNDNRLAEQLYNNVLYFKGVAFQSNKFLKKQLLLTNNKAYLSTYDSIQFSKNQLKLSNLLNENHENEFYFQLGHLHRLEKEFFSELANDSSFLKFSIDEIIWKNVQENLKPNEIAIEIVNIKLEPDERANEIYCALVIDNECEVPKKINLCTADELHELLNIKGSASKRINALYSGENIEKLAELIWEPIENEIHHSSIVYLSVSGLLHQVSFPALTVDKGIEIQMVNSTRMLAEEIIEIGNDTDHYSLIYGNIDYGKPEEQLFHNSYESTNFQSTELVENIQRSNYSSLPFTTNEIDSISKLLSSRGYEFDTLTGSKATKESLVIASINRKPEILHIATHGFYFNPDQSYLLNELLPIRGNGQNNPMFRSGLLFAGANTSKRLKGSELNGILTSFEIANMDLSSTDLVVLSACETGLGDIKGYEGVYGLQRAFKMAGANSLIVSLWKVPDEQTSELMQLFYEFYLAGMSKHEALKSAQKKIRENYPEPFYWAAFKIVD